jgi:hypothetical protein
MKSHTCPDCGDPCECVNGDHMLEFCCHPCFPEVDAGGPGGSVDDDQQDEEDEFDDEDEEPEDDPSEEVDAWQ